METTSLFANYGPGFDLTRVYTRSNVGIMRMHPHFEAYLLPEPAGDTSIFVNGTSCRIHKPFLLLISPFSLHGIDLTFTGETVLRYIVHFGEEFIQSSRDLQQITETRLKDSSGLVILLDGQTLTACKSMVKMSSYYSSALPFQKHLFLAILTLILQSDCECIPFGSDKNNLQIQQIVHYMQEHLAEPISADSVAQQFFISRSKLDKNIRKYTMLSFTQLLNEIRLCHAEFLLRDPSKKVKDIALLSGFQNENYFYSSFKKYKGVTPAKYQRTPEMHYKRIKKE